MKRSFIVSDICNTQVASVVNIKAPFPCPFFSCNESLLFSEKTDRNPSHRGYVPSGRHTLIGVASLVPSGVFSVRGSRLDQHPTHFLDRWVSLAPQLVNSSTKAHDYFHISPTKHKKEASLTLKNMYALLPIFNFLTF